LIVFGLIDGSLFRNLVVEEPNVDLVLGGHEFLFGLDFMEGLVEGLYLLVVDVAGCLESIHELLYPGLPFLEPVDVVGLDPVEFFVLRVQDLVLFSDKQLEVFALSFDGLDDGLEAVFHL
jgi:hypothetical protein